jgi:hypothetical protein
MIMHVEVYLKSVSVIYNTTTCLVLSCRFNGFVATVVSQ